MAMAAHLLIGSHRKNLRRFKSAMVKYPHMPGLNKSRSGSLSCAHFAHSQQSQGAKSQKSLAHANTRGKLKTPLIGISYSGATFPCAHLPIGGSIFPQIEWDGSFVQKRFHSGRTDQAFGHNDLQNRSGLGTYHFHHGEPPHIPCTRSQPTPGESLIDLFRYYGGSVSTVTHMSGGNTTFSFHAIIEVEPLTKFFALELGGGAIRNEFYIAANGERTHVAPFLGTPLNPQFVNQEGSPWTGTTDGFDYLVNAEYFHGLVREHTGLERPTQGRVIDIPEIMTGHINGESWSRNIQNHWFSYYRMSGESPVDENGLYGIVVGPRILNPNYPDDGRIWTEEFDFPYLIDLVLENRSSGVRRLLKCIFTGGTGKAHTFNRYPHELHPRNHLFLQGTTVSFDVESGLHQTGIAYPRSWNSSNEIQFSRANLDGSTIEFRNNGLDFDPNEYRLLQVIVHN